MSILIGADIVPTKSNEAYFQQGDAKYLVGDALLEELYSADYRIFNMEVPLSDCENPIPKSGPHLIAPVNTIKGYQALHADLVTIANNHIMDQGVDGLASTMETLKHSGIRYIGAGNNRQEAQMPAVAVIKDKKVGIYACAEHEFSIRGEDAPGANPYDPLFSYDHVTALKNQCDYVIVLYHGGREQYRYPSPDLQRRCRRFVDKGADLVVCQHSHCVGCREIYKAGTIVYGQGNFLFDADDNEFWETGLFIRLNDAMQVEYIPLRKEKNTVRKAEGTDAQKILAEFNARSEEILNENFIETRYAKLAEKELMQSYLYFAGPIRNNFFFKVLKKLTKGKCVYKYYRRQNLGFMNMLRCEAHRELLVEGLKNQAKKLDT